MGGPCGLEVRGKEEGGGKGGRYEGKSMGQEEPRGEEEKEEGVRREGFGGREKG